MSDVGRRGCSLGGVWTGGSLAGVTDVDAPTRLAATGREICGPPGDPNVSNGELLLYRKLEHSNNVRGLLAGACENRTGNELFVFSQVAGVSRDAVHVRAIVGVWPLQKEADALLHRAHREGQAANCSFVHMQKDDGDDDEESKEDGLHAGGTHGLHGMLKARRHVTFPTYTSIDEIAKASLVTCPREYDLHGAGVADCFCELALGSTSLSVVVSVPKSFCVWFPEVGKSLQGRRVWQLDVGGCAEVIQREPARGSTQPNILQSMEFKRTKNVAHVEGFLDVCAEASRGGREIALLTRQRANMMNELARRAGEPLHFADVSKPVFTLCGGVAEAPALHSVSLAVTAANKQVAARAKLAAQGHTGSSAARSDVFVTEVAADPATAVLADQKQRGDADEVAADEAVSSVVQGALQDDESEGLHGDQATR